MMMTTTTTRERWQEEEEVIESSIFEHSEVGSNVAAAANQRASDATNIIAKKETKAVARVKLVLILVACTAAALAAWGIYRYATGNDTERFEESFKDDAHKILEAIGGSIEQTFGVMDILATTAVVEARQSNSTWPFVTIDNYGLLAAKLSAVSDTLLLSILPLVTNETRLAWEEYTNPNHTSHLDDWMMEVIHVQPTDHNYHGPPVEELEGYGWAPIHDDYGIVPYNSTSPLFLPTWQTYPMVMAPEYGSPANWDWHTTAIAYGDMSNVVAIRERAPVLGEPYMLPTDDPEELALLEAWASWYDVYFNGEEESMEPISDLYYPIIDTVSTVNASEAQEADLVGLIVAQQYWRTFIRDILPTGSNGIDIVFDNACTESFTYRLQGPKESYRGTGDLHETKYEYLGVHSAVGQLDSYAIRDSKYTGIPIANHCPMRVHVYPSQEMMNTYATNDGAIFAIVAICIFVGTSLFFFLYDWMVERRQQIVMGEAVRSTAIVSSLFPESVRHRIMPEAAPGPQTKKSSMMLMSTNNNSSDQAQQQLQQQDSHGLDNNNITNSPPIANLYPETTIMFGDLKGFTQWSSTRSPTEVFTLLESIYSAFDVLAEKRKIFKVETIGDCYVAVCGLPKPNSRHASAMARFSSDCLLKMDTVTKSLEDMLGQDTSNLQLRIGLNSGPTTAGVLRGAKSRFQLFGDTVNTAARMESNSEGGRIMVSQSTADRLIAEGKEDWLTAREGLVEAKGKGSMQCYWCVPPRKTISTSSPADFTLFEELPQQQQHTTNTLLTHLSSSSSSNEEVTAPKVTVCGVESAENASVTSDVSV